MTYLHNTQTGDASSELFCAQHLMYQEQRDQHAHRKASHNA